ncbi:MAG: hypothetical protein IJD17_05530 [Clostridia bacterium]|nr:hypothetical protein [Clostridia bacterium]
MPSALIHLLTGRYFKPDGSIPYFIGTVAPDCVGEREIKDHTHLRDRSDRHEAIVELRDSFDLCDGYQLGALLHLYTDMLWDEGLQKEYKDAYPEPDNAWFRPYRNEISLASAHIFHRSDWGEPLWREMLECPNERFDSLADFPAEAIRGYLTRNYKWHYENDVGPSPAFPPEVVEDFCRDCAAGFAEFLKN